MYLFFRNIGASCVRRSRICERAFSCVFSVPLRAAFSSVLTCDEQFLLEVEQEQPRARAHHRVGRHQLRMREALVDVLVDDVRLVQDQVALDQDRHLAVRIHHRDVFGLVEQVDVADLEVHALFEQHEAAALGERAGGAGIENHHGLQFLQETKGVRRSGAPLDRHFRAGATPERRRST